jgi:hypothetical protein
VATPGFKLNIILSAIFMMKMLQNQQAGRTDFFTAFFLSGTAAKATDKRCAELHIFAENRYLAECI